MRLFLTAMAVSALATVTQAQDLTTGHLQALDANQDGKISKEEYNAFMVAAFLKLDVNKDGSLSAEEAEVVITPAEFAAADTNKNGKLSKSEFNAQVAKDFASADLNADGTLD